MREMGRETGQYLTRSQPRELGRPPPLAVPTMLGWTRRLGQVDARHNVCDFSLNCPTHPLYRPFGPSPGDSFL
jgi:hypothetical protein